MVDFDFELASIRLLLIAEASPARLEDGFYAGDQALFWQTTQLAFQDAGYNFQSAIELLEHGVYLTTAVKCGKTGYGIQTAMIHQCSYLLEQELALLPNLRAILLMGDVAIKALNAIARRQGESRVIPPQSTYKIRSGEFTYHGMRVFPSYLQAGPSFFIEKVKRLAIAEDIQRAMALICD
jgi:uracil-DNA glycosylase